MSRDDSTVFFSLRELTRVDLSQNNLSGEADILFAPAVQYVNFSHNNFTSLNSFKRFKRSHETLQTCDLSFNSIAKDISDLMRNFPPNIEEFLLKENQIEGAFPESLGTLDSLRKFNMASNELSGGIPDFSTWLPNLQELDLSRQRAGFDGTISVRLSNLPFLTTLSLAGNSLTGNIPPAFGNFAQLKALDLSDNGLSQSIPSELGNLAGGYLDTVCLFV